MKKVYPFLFQNLGVRQTILKNALWLSASTILNKVLSLGLIIYAARVLGAEGYGQFTFALAFASLLMIFSDLGLSAIVIREFAREKENKKEFYSLMSLKLVLVFGTFLLIALASFLAAPAAEVRMTIVFLAFFLLLNSVVDIYHSFFHARQKMEYEAWFETLQTALVVASGFFVLFRFPSPEHLSYAYFFAALITLGAVGAFFQFKIFPLRLQWNVLVWKKFLKMSWPLALISLFGVIYSYTDSVMLGYWGTMIETGWYNAAQKIVLAGIIPMGFIGASFYPVLSKFSKESKEKLQKAWDYELETMVALALPLVTGGIVLAQKIIYTFYPADFAPSVLAFQILIGTAGLTFLYRPLYDVMIVLNQQTKTFWITMAGASVNVGLNVVLIPQYSLYGAAAATVVTHLLTLLSILFFIKRFTALSFPVLRMSLTFLMGAVAASAMHSAITHPFFSATHTFLLVPIGAAIYLLVFLLLRKYIVSSYFPYAYA